MTVSRVINDHPNISSDARARVEQSMRQLNYRRSQIARALATSRSGTIGVICTDSGHYGPPKTLRAIEAAARDAGFYLSTANIATVERSTFRSALGHLMDQGIEALVVIAPQAAMLDALAGVDLRMPYVTVEPTGRLGEHTLAIHQNAGARIATQHLVDLGHRNIAHISGPADWLDAQARVEGWRAVLGAAGLRYGDPIVGDWSIEFGYQAARRFSEHDGTTAFFVSNDHMALGLIRGLTERRIRVPHDVSVIGFDDIPEAAYLTPALSTIRPDFTELGRRCMAILVEGLAGNTELSDHLLVPELVVRDSTAPPRTR